MKIRSRLIQQRLSTTTNFFDASDDFKQLKLDYISQGKLIDQGASFSENNLIKTWVLIFNTPTDFSDFIGTSECVEYVNAMQQYNTENQISFSIEQDSID